MRAMSAQSCSVSRCSRRLRSRDRSGTTKKCPSFSIGLMLKCTSHTLSSSSSNTLSSSSVSRLWAGRVPEGCAGDVSRAICTALSRISRRRRRRRRRRGPVRILKSQNTVALYSTDTRAQPFQNLLTSRRRGPVHIEHVPVSCGANDDDEEEEGEEDAMPPPPPEISPFPPFFSFVKLAGGGRRRRLLTSFTENGPSIFMSVSPDRRSPDPTLRSPDPVSRSRAGLGFELVPSAGLSLERCCCACKTAEEEEEEEAAPRRSLLRLGGYACCVLVGMRR